MSVMTRPRLERPPGESKRANGVDAMDALVAGSGSLVRTKRRRKVLAGGIGLILGTALLGALLFSRGSEQRTAIVAATDIGVGEVITPAHLKVVRIARETDVASLPSSAASQLVDRVAAVPISRGALVLPDQVNRTQLAPDGTVLIGAVLEPGALPSPDLRFGDRVRVLIAPTNGSIDNQPKIATEAVVWRVWGSQQAGNSRRAVTLAVPEAASIDVGAAAAQGSIRLLVVPNKDATPIEETGTDPIAPFADGPVQPSPAPASDAGATTVGGN
jgi:hypothetical protein